MEYRIKDKIIVEGHYYFLTDDMIFTDKESANIAANREKKKGEDVKIIFNNDTKEYLVYERDVPFHDIIDIPKDKYTIL